MKINEIIKKIDSEISELKELNQCRFTLDISPADFRTLFFKFSEKHLFQAYNSNEKFEITENNKDILNQIYYYLTFDSKFDGNPYKGLVLMGSFGCGKTTMLLIVKDIIESLTLKRITFVSSLSLHEMIKSNNFEYYYKRPMIIDEIGREMKVVKDYGTEKHPLVELLTHRYNNRALTFGTTNFDYETLQFMYGEYIGERLREMCNFLTVKGKSFRK